MTFEQMLRWLIGIGGGIAAWGILEQITWFKSLPKKQKKFTAMAATAILGAVGGSALVAIGAYPVPVDWVGWVTLIVESGAAAVIAGHTAHGLTLE